MSQDLKRKTFSFSTNYSNVYEMYKQFLYTLDITDETRDWRCKHIRGFLEYLDINNISFKSVVPDNVYSYFATIDNLSLKTKEHRSICIRLFLDWLFLNKKIKCSGRQMLPKIKCYDIKSFDVGFSKEEEIIMLETLKNNKKNINPKRDFIILILLSNYGLRNKDIIYLKLDNIKWNTNELHIFIHKTRNYVIYPMNDDVRYGLLDYIKEERPKVESEYVFINKDGSKYKDSLIYGIIDRCIDRDKIDVENRNRGSHSFRHGLSNKLFKKNYSIYEIAKVLGHDNVNETKTYIQEDIKTLKELTLEVPTWKK